MSNLIGKLAAEIARVGTLRGQYQAMDIGADVPGPRVPVHPPLTGTVRYTWADDEKQLLIWNGDGLFGDLGAAPAAPAPGAAPGAAPQRSWAACSCRA